MLGPDYPARPSPTAMFQPWLVLQAKLVVIGD